MAKRNTKRRLTPFDMRHEYIAGGAIEAGKAVILDVADGDVVEAGTADGISIGRACTSVESGELIKVDQGCFQWAQTGTTITKAHRGAIVYWSDDQTVTLTADPGKEAGIVYDVDAFGVWVLTHIDQHLNRIGVLPTAIGTANQILKVNAGATALEYAADAT